MLRRLTPLSELQEDILQRLGLGVTLYRQLEIQTIDVDGANGEEIKHRKSQCPAVSGYIPKGSMPDDLAQVPYRWLFALSL